jgi:GWxTD domain-containing protein
MRDLRDGRRAVLLLALALLAAGCGGGGVSRSAVDLANPFLGPDWSSWLIGPIARLATPEEVQAFQGLKDDEAAAAFVEGFWKKRGPAVQKAFEQRSAVADRLYGEAGYLGRRTARGAVYVLYGPPGKVEFEVSPSPKESAIELWRYGASAPSGLDGKRPNPFYRFIKRGDVTVDYVPRGQSVRLQPVPDDGP